MLAVTRIRHRIPVLARTQLRGLSASSRTSRASELETVLRSQDPYDRIQLHPNLVLPPFESHTARVDYMRREVRRLGFDVKGAIPNLLPFWAVILNSNATWSVKDMTDGRRTRGFRDRYQPTAQAFVVAAVPEDHWAQGAVLSADPFRGHYFAADFSSAAEDIVKDGGYLFPHYDPDLAPKFEYGPPKLTRLQMEEMVARQSFLWDAAIRLGLEKETENSREVNTLQGDITMFSFPHYRLVYQLETSSGDIIFDTTDILSPPTLLTEVPGSLGRRTELWIERLEEELRPRFYKCGTTAYSPNELQGMHGSPKASDSVVQENILVRALMANPISVKTWEDEFILPSHSTSGGNDLKAALEFSNAFMKQQQGPDPVFEGIRKKAPEISEHLRRRAAAATAASAAARPAAQKKQAAAPRFTASRDHVEARNRLLQQRLKTEVERQRAWQNAASGNWKAPTTPEQGAQSIGAAAYEDIQFKAGRPQPAIHKIISDPRSYYKRLGIQPAPRYLQYFHERAVDAEIKERYRELTLENHPDRAKSPEDEVRLHHIMANINVAKENLETADKRIEYHNKFSPTKLGRLTVE